MLVDPAQRGQFKPVTKQVQHFGVGQNPTVRQPRKGSPQPMFGQQLHQEIEGMGGGQQGQQLHAEQLSGGKLGASPRTPSAWHQRVDQVIGDMR